MYEIPLSVPESHGYSGISNDSVQLQSSLQRFNPLIPTTQSGDGPNIDANETLLCLRSTLKCDEVFALTFGYQSPPAFIKVLNFEPFARNSISICRTDPHSANERKPSVAM